MLQIASFCYVGYCSVQKLKKCKTKTDTRLSKQSRRDGYIHNYLALETHICIRIEKRTQNANVNVLNV